MAGGTSIGTAYVTIVPKVDSNFNSTISKALSGFNASSSGKKVGSQFSSGVTATMSKGAAAISGIFSGMASTAVTGLIGAVGSLGNEMVSAADGAQKFAQTLEFAGIDTSTIDALTQSTQEYADQTVYDLNDIRNVTAQLASNGVENYAQLAEAAGNLNAVAGGSRDTFKSVSMVLSQTAGQGKLVTENWNQLVDAIPGVSGPLQEAMRSAGAFEGNFREAMENGEISAGEFFAAVQKLGMQDIAIEAATSTSTIEGAMGNLQASVVGLGSTLITALTPALTGAMTGLSEMFTTLNTAFSGFLSDVTSGTDIVTAFQTNLAPAFDGIWQQIITGLQNFIAMLPTYAPMVIQGAVGLFTGLVNGLAQVLPMLVQGLGTLIQSAVTTLPQWLPQVIQAAFNLFIGIATAVGNVLVNLLAAIASLIWGGISSFGDFVGDVVSGAQDLWNNACEGVMNTLSDFANAVGEVVQGGIDAVADFIGSAVDAGANLIQGFIDGVLGAAQGLIDAVGGAINDAIGWAKSLLGIASPSKVFKEIGDFTMQGMAIGIGEGSKDAAASMADAVSQIVGEADGISLQAAVEQVGFASVDTIMAGIRSTIDYAREQFQAILQELAQSSDFSVSGLSGLQLDEGIATTVDQTINFNQPVQSAYQVAQAMKRYSTYGLAGAR